jgi:hypothetical protein
MVWFGKRGWWLAYGLKAFLILSACPEINSFLIGANDNGWSKKQR